MDIVSDPEKIRALCKKLSAPLITMVSGESEIQYVVMRNINLIIQKRPFLLEEQVRVF